MKKIKLLLTVGVALFAASTLCATVTIMINTSGFLDSGGGTPGGIPWGLVFDGGGDGFDPDIGTDLLDTFDSSVSGVIGSGNDYYYATGLSTLNIIGGGRITSAAGVPYGGEIVNPNQWGIIWFPDGDASLGASYGWETDVNLVTPADGNSTDYSAFISGGSAGNNIVPEPSTYAAIFGLAVLGLAILRRKRG